MYRIYQFSPKHKYFFLKKNKCKRKYKDFTVKMTPEHLEAKNQRNICERIEKGFIQTINCDPTYFYSTLEISKKHMYSKNVLLIFCPLRPLFIKRTKNDKNATFKQSMWI